MSTTQAITACLCLLFMSSMAGAEVETTIISWYTGHGTIISTESSDKTIIVEQGVPIWFKPHDPATIGRVQFTTYIVRNKIDDAEEAFKAAVEKMNNLSNRSN